MQISLQQAVVALSDALDLVGVDALYHGKRVGFMMVQGYGQLSTELSENQLFQLGLLHDIGVSSTDVHRHLISELEWSGADEHCRVGSERLGQFAPLAALAPYVLYHHTRWDDLLAQGVDKTIALLANWVFLTDRVDSLAALRYQKDILDAKQSIIETITRHSGTLFKPELVELFAEIASGDAFWLAQEPSHITAFVESRAQADDLITLDIAGVAKLAVIFAEVVDCKSTFTHEHSLGVARLSRYIAEQFGLDEAICAKIEIAGLLHDLGKLKVPDDILGKASALDAHERSQINHHSYETFVILSKISGLEEIAQWAGYHHESPDGSGYPFQLKETQLAFESRIIAVADVFQALAQERPYRHELNDDKIGEILRDMASRNRLDRKIVDWVTLNMAACHAQALHYLQSQECAQN